jgi:hypothetical protein
MTLLLLYWDTQKRVPSHRIVIQFAPYAVGVVCGTHVAPPSMLVAISVAVPASAMAANIPCPVPRVGEKATLRQVFDPIVSGLHVFILMA